jgi:hypothetical protein
MKSMEKVEGSIRMNWERHYLSITCDASWRVPQTRQDLGLQVLRMTKTSQVEHHTQVLSKISSQREKRFVLLERESLCSSDVFACDDRWKLSSGQIQFSNDLAWLQPNSLQMFELVQ